MFAQGKKTRRFTDRWLLPVYPEQRTLSDRPVGPFRANNGSRSVLDRPNSARLSMARVLRPRYSEEPVQLCAGAPQDDYLLPALRGPSGQAR
jgi:hypothetical protein